MKQIYLTLATLLLTIFSHAQCEHLELINWTSENDTTFTVEFFSQEEVDYSLVLQTDYGTVDYPFEPIAISGEAEVGINEISISINDSPEGDPFPPFPVQPENVYFTSLLYYECETGLNSDTTKFYMSGHSLTNNPGFFCDSLYMPFEPLPDGPGSPYQTVISIPDNGEIIESLSVFLDIGHTYNGDLSILLTHPSGITVTLHAGQALSLGGSQGFSAIFTDFAGESVQNSNSPNSGPKGIFQPYESFSPFIGLPVSGDWTLTVIDNFAADDGMVFGISLDIEGNFCESSIGGKVFADFDGDGEFSSGDYAYPYPAIVNSIGENTFYGNSNGDFLTCTTVGSGTLDLLNAPAAYTSSTLAIEVNEGQSLDDIKLILVPEFEAIDLAIDLISLEPNRPGFDATYLLNIQNMGTICEQSGELTLNFPEFVEIIASENSQLDFSGNEATMAMIELCPFESLEFEIEITIDDTVSLGAILEAVVEVISSEADANPNDNIFTSSVEVVGSYDPNDKQVSATTIGDEFLENGSPLKYTFRFQNTGTFYAERVIIADTIDANLDFNSLSIISTSHNMQLSREGNVVYFEFDQIFLPDSTTDMDGSMGHVRYAITPLPGFSESDLIENTAYIYFDFNEPIVTNTVATNYSIGLGLVQPDIDVRVFPNPTTGMARLVWQGETVVDRIEIYDLSGRLIASDIPALEDHAQINLEGFTSGVYVAKIISGSLESRVKIVKIGNP